MGDRARKSSPGAEGRVLIQSTLSSSGGMRCHDPFLTIFIPNVSCPLSLSFISHVYVCVITFFTEIARVVVHLCSTHLLLLHQCDIITQPRPFIVTVTTFWSVFKSFPSTLQIFNQEFGAIWASYKCLYRWTRSQSCLKLVYFKK